MGVQVAADDLPDHLKAVPMDDLPDHLSGTPQTPDEQPSVGQFLLHALSGNNLGMAKHAPAVMDLLKKVPGMVAEGGPPAIGAAIGGALGAPLGPPGIIGGAALGGATGGAANRLYRQATMGEPAPDVPEAALQTMTDALGGITQEVAPAVKATNIGPGVGKETQADMVRALKAGKMKDYVKPNLQRSIPDVAATASTKKVPIKGAEDVLNVIPDAKKKIWDAYADELSAASQRAEQEFSKARQFKSESGVVKEKLKLQDEPSVIRPMEEEAQYLKGSEISARAKGYSKITIDGSKIADAMTDTINKRFRLQNPEAAAQIEKVADTYRRPLSLTEAEDFLQSANGDLQSYYAKNKVGRANALKDPTVAHTVAEAEAIRTELYAKLDELPNKSAAELKRRYGALTELQDLLSKRKAIADSLQKDSLAEQISFARGAGDIGMAVLTGEPGRALKGAASMATARHLKNRNTLDAIIERSFKRYNSGLDKEPLPDWLLKALPNLVKQAQ